MIHRAVYHRRTRAGVLIHARHPGMGIVAERPAIRAVHRSHAHVRPGPRHRLAQRRYGGALSRPDERRVGNEGLRTCRSRWSTVQLTKKIKTITIQTQKIY